MTPESNRQESAIFLVTELCDGGDFSELNHGIDDPQVHGARRKKWERQNMSFPSAARK